MPVERIDPRGEDVPSFIKAALEEIEKSGSITQILPLQDELLVVWKRDKPQRETR